MKQNRHAYSLLIAGACLLGNGLNSFGQPAASPETRAWEPVLGSQASADWDIPASSPQAAYRFEDKILSAGAQALTLTGKKVHGPGIEVRARLQLAAPAGQSASFTLRAGESTASASGLAATISATANEQQIANVALYSGKNPAEYLNYRVKAYTSISPIWEPASRSSIEHAMATLPAVNQRWFDLRIQITKTRARFYLDDRMLSEKPMTGIGANGTIKAELSPFVRLAKLEVNALPNIASEFEPVSINSYVNSSVAWQGGGPLDFKSPAPNRAAQIGGVPFLFPQRDGKGNDHIDVGVSQVRQANMAGYLPSNDHRFKGSMEIDPARLQFRIPNGRYDALYLVAGSDNDKNNIPLVSASFYKPDSGFVKFFEATVPSMAATGSTQPVAMTANLGNGKKANLWLIKIPLEPGQLSSFAHLPYLELELSKKIQLFRSYPDPISYGYHPGGLPSGVHVYAMTLHRPAVDFEITPEKFGHVWAANQTPAYRAKFVNRSNRPRTVSVQISTRSYDGKETQSWKKSVTVPAGGREHVERIVLPVKKFGYHDVAAQMEHIPLLPRATPSVFKGSIPAKPEQIWVERRSLVKLAPDTRAAKWREGHGPLIGNWAYFGAHETPGWEEHLRLMHAAGSRTATFTPTTPEQRRVFGQLNMVQHKAFAREHWITMEWLWNGGYKAADPAGSTAALIEALRKDKTPSGDGVEPEFMTFFPEPHISRDLTAGNLPDYWGEPAYQMNAEEQAQFKLHWDMLLNGARAVKKEWPDMKVLIPWGDPLYVVPFLRAGFPKELVDGTGLDIPNFERLPEQQLHQISLHRLYQTREEFRKAGIPNPQMHFLEGFFVPTEPGAVNWRDQMDIYTRGLLISMGYGVQRFYSWGGTFIDASSYYGAEHYGGNGLFTRIPYVNPKPSYAGFATTTLMLDGANFEKWIPTGSLSTYCMKFSRDKGGPLYALWTVRGKRPVTVTNIVHMMNGASGARLTDMMGNPAPLTVNKLVLNDGQALNGQSASFVVDSSPVWLTGMQQSDFTIKLGTPDHSDARQGQYSKPLSNLGDGTWRFTDERDEIYENNNYDTKRFFGPISGRAVAETGKGKVLSVSLGQPDKERKVMPFYRVLRPAKPITIAGKASHLGLWAKGNSDWGRVVYSLRDKKGERWLSVGTKDEYNADDLHSWSKFNYDGWRYLRFEMPSHLPYDNYREAGTNWWGSYGGDGVVDLPLKLESIIVERRTHILYVNDIQPANRADVLLGNLVAEYARPEHRSAEIEKLSALRMPIPRTEAALPNPIADLMKTGAGAATAITGVKAPEWGYDGTRTHVNFTEVAGAQSYDIWLSAHADGRGAVRQATGWKKSGELLQGLRPAMNLYLFVTYTDKDGKVSKPSPAFKINLVDAFGMK